jgi:hypothetical protein
VKSSSATTSGSAARSKTPASRPANAASASANSSRTTAATSNIAQREPSLAAVVGRRTRLAYDEMVDGRVVTTPVRSASSLTRTSLGIAVAQDDANFIVVFDEDCKPLRTFPLAAGDDGHRHFDGLRGGKEHKLDLESAVTLTGAHGEMLLQFGSGSTSRRERVAILTGMDGSGPEPSLVHVPRLYDALRRATPFAGSELNIEGAVQVGDRLRLFSRGNGATRGDLKPVNASCDVHWRALLAHLHDPIGTAPPEPGNIVQYELGALDGIPLGFTDVTAWNDIVYYTAAAEDSPDTYRDGRVPGSAMGVIESAGARWAPITEQSGAIFPAKVEGLLPSSIGPTEFLVVVDSDHPDAQSELCTVELAGPW